MTSDAQPDAAPSFATDIKPLFRERDRTSMLFAFDLWSYDDVKAHQTAIIDYVAAGSMPCDGPWPAADVALIRRWAADGSLP